MNELDAQRCYDLVFAALPEFRERLLEFRGAWQAGPPGLGNELGELASFVLERVASKDTARLPSLFAAAEQLLQKGTEDVKNAVATRFLEDLQNLSSEEAARVWVPLLGAASRSYCEAWDAFSGVQTPGLKP